MLEILAKLNIFMVTIMIRTVYSTKSIQELAIQSKSIDKEVNK